MSQVRTPMACAVAVLLLWSTVLFAMAVGPAQAAAPRSQDGVVTWVTDGDSLWFTPPGKPPIRVRLRDIDAPEICQPGGVEAREALEKLAFKQPATLTVSGRDAYGRSLGTVSVGGLDVAPSLVEAGHAWSSRSRWDQGPLVKQERMARALSRGLHGVPGAVMPAEFRRNHGPCVDAAGAATAVVAAPGVVPLFASIPAPPSAALQAPNAAAPKVAPRPAAFACDSRTRCAQMTSCNEARYFLAHCPGVTMDGNRDGKPCEKQWCH